MNKKDLSERDICSRYITPAIRDTAGWQVLQIFEQLRLSRDAPWGKFPFGASKYAISYYLDAFWF